MSGYSTYAADKFLNWLKGSAMGTAPTALYAALFDGDPTDSGAGGTEVTGDVSSDGREAATFGSISGKLMTNNAEIDYGNSEADVNVTHIGIFDDPTAGNMLGSFALSPARSVTTGDPVKFSIGDLTISMVTP